MNKNSKFKKPNEWKILIKTVGFIQDEINAENKANLYLPARSKLEAWANDFEYIGRCIRELNQRRLDI